MSLCRHDSRKRRSWRQTLQRTPSWVFTSPQRNLKDTSSCRQVSVPVWFTDLMKSLCGKIADRSQRGVGVDYEERCLAVVERDKWPENGACLPAEAAPRPRPETSAPSPLMPKIGLCSPASVHASQSTLIGQTHPWQGHGK